MAYNHANLTKTVAQIAAEAANVVVKARTMASGEKNQRAQNEGPKIGGPLMR